MKHTFNAEQQQALNSTAHTFITGAPGVGKTTLLLEKARRLVLEHGAGKVAVASFSYRGAMHLERLLAEKQVKVGTLRDFALKALSLAEQAPGAVIDNTHVRQVLRVAMQDSGFEGTLEEAEHILRRFKGRGAAPADRERYYSLARAYRALCEDQGLVDRHDVVRQHLIGMSNGQLAPLKYQFILVDNIQDANELQYIWLKKHVEAGATLVVCGCAEPTLFGRDGALGGGVFEKLKNDLPQHEHIQLEQNYRLGKQQAVAAEKIASLLNDRQPQSKAVKAVNDVAVDAISSQSFDHKQSELVALKQLLKEKESLNDCKIGVICRHDYNSNRVASYLQQQGVALTNLSMNLWQTPGAQVLLDLLEVLLNMADDTQLRRVLRGYGLSAGLVNSMMAEGLVAKDWLKRGGVLPETVKVPSSSLQVLGLVQRRLAGGWRLMTTKQARPREVFKAAAYDLLMEMDDADRKDALLALDVLLHLRGKLTEVLPKIHQMPAFNAEARVTVLPVREARNLEFDEVVVMDLEDKSWPNTQGVALGMDENHERSLFYMALTRAKGSVSLWSLGKAGSFYEAVSLQLKRAKKHK